MSSSSKLSLSGLARGQKALITAIDPDHSGSDMHLRLHEMGFDEGIEIEVIHQGPFGGDPLAVSVEGVIIAVRRSEASKVQVMLVPEVETRAVDAAPLKAELAGAKS